MRQIEVIFRHHSDQLAGTLSIPQGDGPHPAIVMLQGSGPADRTNGNYFPSIRDYLVAQGLAVLCYDKPGTGSSTGDWQRQSFENRAQEALAALDYLREMPMINAEKIGLWGHSQGGWIVFLAASFSDKVAFIVSNSGPGISLQEQDRYGLEQSNIAKGVPKSEIEQALTLYGGVIEAIRQDRPFEQIAKMIAAQRNQAWDNYFDFDMGGWEFMRRNYEYDPFPVIQKVKCPVVAVFGEQDLLVPAHKSAAIFKEALEKGGNRDLTVHIFPDADHRIKVNHATALAEGYLETMGKSVLEQIYS